MGEHHPPRPLLNRPGRQLPAQLVGQVPRVPRDPRLELPGIWPRPQHLRIIIKLPDEGMSTPHPRPGLGRHVPRVGAQRQLPPPVLHGKPRRAGAVVAGGKGADLPLPQGEPLSRREHPEPLLQPRPPGAQGEGGALGGEQRGPALAAQHRQGRHMVGVLMGDEHPGDMPQLQPQPFQPLGDPPGGNARVNQNMYPPVADHRAVPRRPACQRRRPEHTHPPKLSLFHKQAGKGPRPFRRNSQNTVPRYPAAGAAFCSGSGTSTARISAPIPDSFPIISS